MRGTDGGVLDGQVAIVTGAGQGVGRGVALAISAEGAKVFQSIRRMTDAEMETMWQSGPMASFRFMQVCFAYLREAKGCVINMGSGSGIMPHGAMSVTR